MYKKIFSVRENRHVTLFAKIHIKTKKMFLESVRQEKRPIAPVLRKITGPVTVPIQNFIRHSERNPDTLYGICSDLYLIINYNSSISIVFFCFPSDAHN